MTDRQEKCIKRRVPTVVRNVKYPSSQLKDDLCTARSVLVSIDHRDHDIE